MYVVQFKGEDFEIATTTEEIRQLARAFKTKIKAPGMGFEPMRTIRSTGSQGPRVIHSAIPAHLSNWVSGLFLFSVPRSRFVQ
jgi:hypothetical protein